MPSLAIVPAAGRAERFGRQKLLEDLGGELLLNRTIRSLLDAGVDRVAVVVPPDGGLDAVPLLADPRVETVVNPDPSRGMFSSIQVAFEAVPKGDPVLVLPGDMPFVAPATVAAVLACPSESSRVVVPRYHGQRGHPVSLPRALGSEILMASARSNLSGLLTSLGIEREYLDVTDPGILRDIDVRSDLES